MRNTQIYFRYTVGSITASSCKRWVKVKAYPYSMQELGLQLILVSKQLFRMWHHSITWQWANINFCKVNSYLPNCVWSIRGFYEHFVKYAIWRSTSEQLTKCAAFDQMHYVFDQFWTTIFKPAAVEEMRNALGPLTSGKHVCVTYRNT